MVKRNARNPHFNDNNWAKQPEIRESATILNGGQDQLPLYYETTYLFYLIENKILFEFMLLHLQFTTFPDS